MASARMVSINTGRRKTNRFSSIFGEKIKRRKTTPARRKRERNCLLNKLCFLRRKGFYNVTSTSADAVSRHRGGGTGPQERFHFFIGFIRILLFWKKDHRLPISARQSRRVSKKRASGPRESPAYQIRAAKTRSHFKRFLTKK